MNRRFLFRVLLSLLLLVSQQIAAAHVISHLHGSSGRPVAQKNNVGKELAQALAQDQACNQCLAFAQLSGPLGSKQLSFALPDPITSTLVRQASHPACARTICPFEPRGPPSA